MEQFGDGPGYCLNVIVFKCTKIPEALLATQLTSASLLRACVANGTHEFHLKLEATERYSKVRSVGPQHGPLGLVGRVLGMLKAGRHRTDQRTANQVRGTEPFWNRTDH